MLLILVAALPVMALYVWSALDQRQETLATAEDQLLRSARLLAAQQNQFFEGTRSVLSTMLLAAEAVGVPSDACNALLRSIGAREPNYLTVRIAAPDGNVLCSSSADTMGINIADRGYFQDAVATGAFVVGMPQMDDIAGRTIIPLALPLRGGSAGEVGLVGMVGFDYDGLMQTLALSRLPAGGIAVIFNRDRAIIARLPQGVTIADAMLAPVRPEVAQESGGAGLVRGEPENGEGNLWAVSQLLPEQGLYVAIGVPVSTIVAGAESGLRRGIGILLLVLALAALSAWLVGQVTINGPLDRLGAAAAALRNGDLKTRAHLPTGAPELRRLAHSFNDMAASIEHNDQELQQRNAKLNQLIDDKEMLVREMNHRIKNSLQLVSSMVGLQLGNVSDPAARSSLVTAQARVATIAKVHERLYAGARLDRVDVALFLSELCRDLAQTLGVNDHGGAVVVSSVDVSLPPDKAIPLGLITTELVTNAVKHGHNDGPSRTEVTLSPTGSADELCLSISDNGPGLPADVESHTGLGLRVIRALAAQLGGELEFERLPSGTRFFVRFLLDGAEER